MRIWYQSFTSVDASQPYPRAVQESMRGVLGKETSIAFGAMKRSVASGHHLRAIQAFDIPELLRSLLEAERAGHDAVIIGNALDPGLYEARQLLRIPVLSIGQTVLLYAQHVATKVLVVASGSRAVGLLKENVLRYGLTHGIQDIVAPSSDLSVAQMTGAFTDTALQEEVVGAFRDGVSRYLTEETGAVIPMAGILQALLYHASVFSIDERPILPGYLVTALIAEAAAKLSEMGISTSGHGLYAPLSPDLKLELARVWPQWYQPAVER